VFEINVLLKPIDISCVNAKVVKIFQLCSRKCIPYFPFSRQPL